MLYRVLVLLLCLLPLVFAGDADIQGLWEVVSITDLTEDKVEDHPRQWQMFTETHQMIVLAGKDRKKIKKSFYDMTTEELNTQLPVGAGFYRYRVEGTKLIRTNILALSAYYEGKTFETDYLIESNMLTIRDRHAADGHLREWKLKRVE